MPMSEFKDLFGIITPSNDANDVESLVSSKALERVQVKSLYGQIYYFKLTYDKNGPKWKNEAQFASKMPWN